MQNHTARALLLLSLSLATTAPGSALAATAGRVDVTATPAAPSTELGAEPLRNVVRLSLNGSPIFLGSDLVYERMLLPWVSVAAGVGGGGVSGGTSALGRLHLGTVFRPLAAASLLSGLRLGLGADVYLAKREERSPGEPLLTGLPTLSTQAGYGWTLAGLDITAAVGLTLPAVFPIAVPWASVGVGKAF